MRDRNSLLRAARWLGALAALACTAVAQPSPGDSLKTQGLDTEITVFPMGIGGRSMPEGGEALAMMLERGGMRNMEWTSTAFPGGSQTGLEQMAADFGNFVRRGAISAGYALYAECLTAPGVGDHGDPRRPLRCSRKPGVGLPADG